MDSKNTTRLLHRAVHEGDAAAASELMEVVYAELKRLAHRHLSPDRPEQSLQPTALVHEAWLRLVRQDDLSFPSRGHFFAFASKIMRSVLVDHVRAKNMEKRGGERERISVVDAADGREDSILADVIDLEDALNRLETESPELVKIVELRFFGGLTLPEVADTLGVSLRTTERHWRFARAWLHTELSR